MKQQLPRSRPTNNQLLYKAHFRWEHYSHRQLETEGLSKETEPCASVTAAFLKVLGIAQRVETACTPRRNILQILANNTRRTKVLELSSGTHRIPDELKKHFLTDENGAQYSTNLDRNRYGSDNNYLFTVIKHDLETLGLCPCLVDVEIIDAKAHGDSQLVTAGLEACTCTNTVKPQGMPPPAAQGECSQLFEALVAAAADATAEQAEADTAAQDGFTGHANPAENHSNGAAPPAAATAAAAGAHSSPAWRRPPRRVPTGLFSVNSSDLMGCGLSNLGNSGLVVGEDADRRGEVEQGAPKRRRTTRDPDTISEQGDTERYLKNMNPDTAAEAPMARRVVPRQSSMIAANNSSPSKDLRSLWLEMQALQRSQQQVGTLLEGQKRSYVECDALIGQAQRGIVALQEDRVMLKGSLEALEQRVHSLEGAAQNSSAQIAALQGLVVAMLSKDAPAASSDAVRHQLSLFQDLPGAQASGQLPPASSALQLIQSLNNGNAAPAPLHAAADATADHRGPGQEGAGVLHLRNGEGAVLQGASVPGGGDLQAASLNGTAAPLGSSDQLAPIAQLQHTHAAPAPAATAGNTMRQDGVGATPGHVQDGLEGIPGGDPQVMDVKFEDSEAIKMLPKFDNFGSLSDLGSLFSGGQGRSREVRSGGRQPPRANLSITSPHPTLMQSSNLASTDIKAADLESAQQVQSTPV